MNVFDNLIGDLEYHPKRAVVYLGLGIAALCVWMFASPDAKLNTVPLLFVVGSLMLFLKGIFFLRKTSDGLASSSQGLGLTKQAAVPLRDSSSLKAFPSMPSLAAQIVQDFGAGGVLLGPVLNVANNINESWKNLPSFPVFIGGAILFFIGWIIRRIFSSASLAEYKTPE